MGLASLFLRSFAPAVLAVFLIAASSCTSAEKERLQLEQPNTAIDRLDLQVTPLWMVNKLVEKPVPQPRLLSTPDLDRKRKSDAGGRPLDVTLTGVSVLCVCALGPVLIIVAVIGAVIRVNRQKPLA